MVSRIRLQPLSIGLVSFMAVLLASTGLRGQQPTAQPPLLPPAPPALPEVPAANPPTLPPATFSIPRFSFIIDPKTPAKDLLPVAPRFAPLSGPMLSERLAEVPEVDFQARPAKIDPNAKFAEQTAHQLAKINHLNATKTDAFMSALLANRPDLAGLPFAMGDDCRTLGVRTKQFTLAVNTVRQSLGFNLVQTEGGPLGPTNSQVPPGSQSPLPAHRSFWSAYQARCQQEDAARGSHDKALTEHIVLARIAALMQMLAPESPEIRLGLVKYLSSVQHPAATQALARMAMFSAEDSVRLAAIDSLKVRREKDYSEILVRGLRYPWPAVAARSADAIARLERKDLIPELLSVLDNTDPRMPSSKSVSGKKEMVVREMVKVNHHRNCMMCHAPGNSGTVSAEAITAEVPIQSQSLPTPSQGYRQSSPDLMIRVDVTYLRQDFSVMLPVADAHPWPELQRFDFLVRERTLTSDEAAAYRDKFTPKEEGVLSPYHRAALAALRDLTGKDTAPTAEAWRKLLGKQSTTSTDTPSRERPAER